MNQSTPGDTSAFADVAVSASLKSIPPWTKVGDPTLWIFRVAVAQLSAIGSSPAVGVAIGRFAAGDVAAAHASAS